MKMSKLFAIINTIIIFLIFFIGFQVIKLKNNIINYAILGGISGCLLYLYPKVFDSN